MSNYNPADHTIDEVKEYIEGHPGEAEAIRTAEETGKNRSTLMDWLKVQPSAGPLTEEGGVTASEGQRQMVETDDATSGQGRFPGDPNTYPDPENPTRAY